MGLTLQLYRPQANGDLTSFGPTEQELLRRMWWLIYTGDRSAALSEGGRMLIGEEELIETSDPLLRYAISVGGPLTLSNPDHHENVGISPRLDIGVAPSVLDGFGYITKIWRCEFPMDRWN
jgi:hypothetical protein